jgi:hypothetical protein
MSEPRIVDIFMEEDGNRVKVGEAKIENHSEGPRIVSAIVTNPTMSLMMYERIRSMNPQLMEAPIKLKEDPK